MLVIKNLVDGDGKVSLLIQLKSRVLTWTLGLSAELQLDYFEVIGNAVHWGGGQTLACK